MTPSRQSLTIAIGAFALGALAAGGVALWLSGDASSSVDLAASQEPGVARSEAETADESDPFAIPPDQMAALMEQLRQVESAPSEEDEAQADAPPALPPTQVQYTVAEKYGGQKLSEVDHRMLGAWDDARDTQTPGRHRSFVLVVDPDLSDQQLESLARDVHQLHHDADRLDVRIYDRENAATDARVTDGGRYAHAHQVAQVKRHRGLDVDVIRVRGRIVGP